MSSENFVPIVLLYVCLFVFAQPARVDMSEHELVFIFIFIIISLRWRTTSTAKYVTLSNFLNRENPLRRNAPLKCDSLFLSDPIGLTFSVLVVHICITLMKQ